MKDFKVEFGHRCNNFCVFCINLEKKSSGNAFDLIKKHVKSFAKNGGEKLIVSGGEPLISKNFFDLLAFAKKNGVQFIEIHTNGRMLSYNEMVVRLKKFEPLSFLVSFHFPNNKLYKKYSKSNGFYQTVRGIKNLVKNDCRLYVTTLVMKQNLAHLEKMIKMLKSIGVKNYQYKFTNGENFIDAYKDFVPRYRECFPILKKIINENSDLTIRLRHFPVCIVGKKFKNVVSPILNRERLDLDVLGKVSTTGKLEARQFVFPNCKKCIYASTCQGIRKEYTKIYGIKEFKPITQNNFL